MERLNRRERPMLYGISGSSKWLLDASMIIWNVVGIVGLIGLIAWMRERFAESAASEPANAPSRGERRSPLTAPGFQLAHARSVVGDETSETILERELQRSGTIGGTGDLSKAEMAHARSIGEETSEDILERELRQSATPHGEPAEAPPTSEDILRAELADARGQGERGKAKKKPS